VPKVLLDDYPKSRILFALKTMQYRDASRQSQILFKRLDNQWFHIQLDAMGLDNVQANAFQLAKAAAPLMSKRGVYQRRGRVLKLGGKYLVTHRCPKKTVMPL
jgi:hypothetical protein